MPDINDAAERVPMIVPSITDNDRSSVERVRAGISGTGNYLSPLLIHKCDLQSLVKIADFALSQLAERDETAIDEAWIKSIAPHYWEAGREYTWPGTPLRWAAEIANGTGVGREGVYLDTPTKPHYLDHITTRGQLLRLLSALNIKPDAGAK